MVSRREFLQSAPRYFLNGIRAFANQIALAAPVAADQEQGLRRIALIDATKCLAWGHTPCQVCYLRCPLRDEAILLDEGRPMIVASVCDGCGICTEACRAVNDLGAIQIIEMRVA